MEEGRDDMPAADGSSTVGYRFAAKKKQPARAKFLLGHRVASRHLADHVTRTDDLIRIYSGNVAAELHPGNSGNSGIHCGNAITDLYFGNSGIYSGNVIRREISMQMWRRAASISPRRRAALVSCNIECPSPPMILLMQRAAAKPTRVPRIIERE